LPRRKYLIRFADWNLEGCIHCLQVDSDAQKLESAGLNWRELGIEREGGVDGQVAAAVAAIDKPDADTIVEGINELFERGPERDWRAHVEAVAAQLVEPDSDAEPSE
jgi:hypothetical protein